MKKIFLIVIIFISTISLNSCKKALEEMPKSSLSPEQFFKSDADAVLGVNGVYFSLVGDYPARLFQQELWSYLDEQCDNITSPDFRGPLNISPIASGFSQTMWNGLYKGIYTASQVIDKVPKSGSSMLKDRSVAEARFLRALFYYYLMGLYRDAPLVTEQNYADVDVTGKLPRTPAAELRKFMIVDLKAAIAVLPNTYGTSDRGRASKAAAQTLLTKVYLWEKDWLNALKTAQDVTGYSLLPNYADVFKADNEFNNEMIFEIDFAKDKSNSYQHAMYSPSSTVGVEPFKSKPWYGAYFPFESYANSFSPLDKRKATIITKGYNGELFKPDRGMITWFGPKFWRLDAGERDSSLDIYLFRYADVLLMIAEAANEDGKSGVAHDAINQVRKRAGLPDLVGLSKDDLRKAIQQERSWELLGEGHRKLDLVRWGIWLETVVNIAKVELPGRAASYQKKYEYLPITASEVEKNPNLLPQNEGY